MTVRAATLRDLTTAATRILTDNDRGDYVAPGPHQYPGQWNWDAAFITIGLAHIDPERARREVEQLLRGQWADGLVPHIVFWNDKVDYFPGPDVWQSSLMRGAPVVPTSGVTQPPVLATAVRVLHELAPNREFLEKVLPPIERWHQWLYDSRRLSGALLAVVHPWESGTDNSPRFDGPLHSVEIDRAIEVKRRDTAHVPSRQRPEHRDYERYLTLVHSLRGSGYQQDLKTASFAYGDVAFTSIACRAEADLMWLWEELGASADPARGRLDSAHRAIDESWDETTGAFLDMDELSGEPVQESAGCVTSLLPLLVGDMTSRRADTLGEAIWDGDRFGPSAHYPWAVTSVAKSDPAFDRYRYWRGPVWVNMNWLLVRGLELSGRVDDASRLGEHTVELVSRHGMHEYYDPKTGRGLGSDRFSWTAALTLDLLNRP